MKKYLVTGLVLFSAQLALAHGVGQTIEQRSGEYMASLTVSEQEIFTMEPIRFSFELGRDGKDVPFSSVWVKLENTETVLLTAEVHQPLSGLLGNLNYTFLKPGDYQLTARFAKDDNKITETAFPLTVKAEELPAAEEKTQQPPWLYALAGLVAGVLVTWLMKTAINKK